MNFQKNILFFTTMLGLAACGQVTGVGTSGGSGTGAGGGTTDAGVTCNPCRIFSTTTVTKGDFASGGSIVAAADAVCAADAGKPVTGTYKALIWDAGVRQAPSTDWPLRSGVAYTRPDSTAIGTGNSDGSLTLPLTNGIIAAAGTYHWTGLSNASYPVLAAGLGNCTNFTNNTNGVQGTTGTGSITASGAFIGMTTVGRPCDDDNHFYCVEQ